jgi:hypothetical protein
VVLVCVWSRDVEWAIWEFLKFLCFFLFWEAICSISLTQKKPTKLTIKILKYFN